jgi:hypothetical protein
MKMTLFVRYATLLLYCQEIIPSFLLLQAQHILFARFILYFSQLFVAYLQAYTYLRITQKQSIILQYLSKPVMYSTSKKIIAFILLGSHILMTTSCSGNFSIPTGQQIAHEHKKLDKKSSQADALVSLMNKEVAVDKSLTNQLPLEGNREALPLNPIYSTVSTPVAANKNQSLVLSHSKTASRIVRSTDHYRKPTRDKAVGDKLFAALNKSKGLDSDKKQMQAQDLGNAALTVTTSSVEKTIIERSFMAKGGHQIQLKKQNDTWIAIVQENAPRGFSRTLCLDLYLAPGFTINGLSKYSLAWQGAHISVIFPEASRNKRGYVYIGSTGLLGGGNGNSKPREGEQCKKCRRTIDGIYLLTHASKRNPLIPGNIICYSCEDAEQARKEREHRQREETLRREQERVREEQQEREQARREREERHRAREILRRNEKKRIQEELAKVKADKNKIERLSEGLNRVQDDNQEIRAQLDQLEHTTREHTHLEQALLHRHQFNKTFAWHIKDTHAISEVLEEEFVQAQRSLEELTEQRESIQNRLDAQRIAIQDKEEYIQAINAKLQYLRTEKEIAISTYKRAIENIEEEEVASTFKRYAGASGMEDDLFKLDQIEPEIQALQVALAEEQRFLSQQQEAASNLTEAFKRQIEKERQSKEALESLEEELIAAQEATQKLSLLAEKFNHAVSNQKQVENLAELVKEAWHTTQHLEETLLASQHRNEALYKQIRQTYSKQEKLPETVLPFYYKVAALSKQTQQAQSEELQINALIKQAREQIKEIEEALKNLKKLQDAKQAELLDQGNPYSKGDTAAAIQKDIEEINQHIQAMQERLGTEGSKLHQQQREAKHLQKILEEHIQQTEKQKELIIQVQHELGRNQEIEDAVEALINEDLKQSLAQSIAADERVEDFVKRLYIEEELLKARGLSKQAAEELSRNVKLEEEKIYADHIRNREAEQAQLAAESADLRNACSARQAELEKRLQELAEEEITDQVAYEENVREWEVNNQFKCQQETQRLSEMRQAAEEARRIAEEGRRELERQQAEAAKPKKEEKGFWGKLWDGCKSVAKATYNGVKKVAKATWDGIKKASTAVVAGLKYTGTKIVEGAKAIGEGAKSLVSKAWDVTKKAAEWIWEHKWEILAVAAISVTIWGIGLGIAALLSSMGIGSMTAGGSAIVGWLTGTTVGKATSIGLGGLGLGWLKKNSEQLTNWLRGRGWKTNAQYKEQDKKDRTGDQQSRHSKPTEQDRPTDRPSSWFDSEAERMRNRTPKPPNQKEDQYKEEAAYQEAENARKQAEEAILRKEEEAKRKIEKDTTRQKEEAKVKAEQAARQKEEESRKRAAIRRGKERITDAEDEAEPTEEESTVDSTEDEKEALLQEEDSAEAPSTSGVGQRISDFFQNVTKNFANSLNATNHAQQKEEAKAAAIQKHTQEVQQILAAYQQTGLTQDLQEEAQGLFEELEVLIESEEREQDACARLSNRYDNSFELQERIDKRLKELAENLQKLKEARKSLVQIPALLPEADIDGDLGDQATYEALTTYFKNPTDAAELASNAQKAVENLLQQSAHQSKEVLKEQAQELRDALASLVKNVQTQHAHIKEVYEDNDASDYLQHHADHSQELKSLESSMKYSQASLDQLCKGCNLSRPDLTPEPPITPETIKKAFNTVLEYTVPGAELIKVLLGVEDSPKTQTEWLKLAAISAIDLVPGGKALKLLKGAAGKVAMKKMEKQLLKEARKAARRMGKATTIKVSKVAGKGLWILTKEGASSIKNHKNFGKLYKSSSDGLWWSVDKAGHGGSKFKVFKETNKGLEWFRDADEFGNFIINKHKGSTGVFIAWGQLNAIK